MFIISDSIRESGTWKQLSWVVLAQGLSGACDQYVTWGRCHLKAWLGLRDLPLRCLLSGLLAGDLSYSLHRPGIGLLVCLYDMAQALSRVSSPRQKGMQRSSCLG